MEKKKIVWITEDSFIDVDMGIIPSLRSRFDIHWIVIMQWETNRELPDNDTVNEVVHLKGRKRSISTLSIFYHLIKKVKDYSSDLIYLDIQGAPYFFPLVFRFLDVNKVVYLAHNIEPRPAWNRVDKLFIPYMLKRLKYVHAISSQYNAFLNCHYPNLTYYNIPMPIKSFGNPDVSQIHNKVRFLFFGHVAVNKRLDKLISAYQMLPKELQDKSELYVYGKCSEPDKYIEMSNGNEHIVLNFGFVKDKDIPNIFSTTSFLVLPYDDVSQSGPSMIAYNYNVPLICTDLPGFKEIVENGKTGFLYKTNDTDSLEETLEFCIELTSHEYEAMKDNLKKCVDSNYTLAVLTQRYAAMFNDIMKSGL